MPLNQRDKITTTKKSTLSFIGFSFSFLKGDAKTHLKNKKKQQPSLSKVRHIWSVCSLLKSCPSAHSIDPAATAYKANEIIEDF